MFFSYSFGKNIAFQEYFTCSDLVKHITSCGQKHCVTFKNKMQTMGTTPKVKAQ